MDEFDRAVADRIANLERELTVRTREIRTLIRDLAIVASAAAALLSLAVVALRRAYSNLSGGQ